MAWLCVPGLEDLNLDSTLLSEIPTELWVTLSGKPQQRPLSWRGWKTRPWVSRLFGTISKPSMAERGAAEWISSLPDIHVNPSQSPVAAKAKPTPGTFGPTLPESSESASHDSCSSKTSRTICDWDFEASPKIYDTWVTALRRLCSERRKSALRTGESDSLCWPTAATSWFEGRGATSPEVWEKRQQQRIKEGKAPYAEPLHVTAEAWHTPKASIDKAGLPREQSRQDLQAQSIQWPTPRSSANENRTTRHAPSHGKTHGRTLAGEAAQWLTPNVPNGGRSVPLATVEVKGSTPEGKRAVGLESQTRHWTTPQTHDVHPGNAARVRRYGTKHGGANLTDDVQTFHPDPQSKIDGITCWCNTPNCGQQSHKQRLNPLFVEWMMGWPRGWTGFAPVETESWLFRQRSRLSCLLENFIEGKSLCSER